MSFLTQDDVVKYLIAIGLLDSAGGVKAPVKSKTADYVIVSATDPSGTIFNNRGALGAVVFTLPPVVPAMAGVIYEFFGVADFALTVNTTTPDTMVGLNDIAADGLAQSTATKLIGSHMHFLCDGVQWAGYGDAVGGTYTIAT